MNAIHGLRLRRAPGVSCRIAAPGAQVPGRWRTALGTLRSRAGMAQVRRLVGDSPGWWNGRHRGLKICIAPHQRSPTRSKLHYSARTYALPNSTGQHRALASTNSLVGKLVGSADTVTGHGRPWGPVREAL